MQSYTKEREKRHWKSAATGLMVWRILRQSLDLNITEQCGIISAENRTKKPWKAFQETLGTIPENHFRNDKKSLRNEYDVDLQAYLNSATLVLP